MRASRLLSIQMLLQTRGRMSATELARALEISVRTLYRDVDALSAAGVPVYAERGRAGGFQLLPGWKTTLTGLTPGEAEAVFLSGLAGPAADLGLAQQVRDAQLKLLAALPAPARADAGRISARLHLDPIDWYREADDLPHLRTVARAVWEERQLEVAYESWTRTAVHTLHPLGLVLKAGIWYLVAARETQLRTFRISGIREARLLEARCTRPARFDLAAHWREAVRKFEHALYTQEAVVAATARGLAGLRRVNAAMARALRDVRDPRAGRRARVRIPVESTGEAVALMLRLAGEVEALRPLELRAAVERQLQMALRLYRRSPAPRPRDQAPGATPRQRLKARLNAASDS